MSSQPKQSQIKAISERNVLTWIGWASIEFQSKFWAICLWKLLSDQLSTTCFQISVLNCKSQFLRLSELIAVLNYNSQFLLLSEWWPAWWESGKKCAKRFKRKYFNSNDFYKTKVDNIENNLNNVFQYLFAHHCNIGKLTYSRQKILAILPRVMKLLSAFCWQNWGRKPFSILAAKHVECHTVMGEVAKQGLSYFLLFFIRVVDSMTLLI